MKHLTAQIDQLLRDFNPIGLDDLPEDEYDFYTPQIIRDFKLRGTSKHRITAICLDICGLYPAENHLLYAEFIFYSDKIDALLKAYYEGNPPGKPIRHTNPYPQHIHFCSDYNQVWWHYRSLRERFDEGDPKSYIGFTHNLLLASLLTEHITLDKGYIQGGIERKYTVADIEAWLLDYTLMIPRAIRVSLWLSLDIVCGDASGYFYSEEMYEYLLTDYLPELQQYVLKEQHNVFLSNYMLNYARWQFGYVERLWPALPFLDEIRRDFYVLNPIFFPYYMDDDFMGLEVDFEARIANTHSKKTFFQKQSDKVKSLAKAILGIKPPKPAPKIYQFDAGFFDRLREQAKLLRPSMKVLDYLLWYGEHRYQGKQAQYDQFVIWLRDHGFEFDGDDPLGLKDLADQWKDVNQSPVYTSK